MITRIALQNVLAFRDIDVESRLLTILSGTNSAGKSSLLHALAVLRQSNMAGTLPDALLLNGELVDLGTGRDMLHSEPDELAGIEGFALRIALESGENKSEWLAQYEAAADVLTLASPTPSAQIGGLFEPRFQYLRADRIVPAVTYPKSHEAVAAERFLGADGRHAPNYLRVHGEEPVADGPVAHPHAVSARLPG